ncbi:ABC transporter ATP-binding protein [Lactobacillus sp. W8093]|nr:ABC transporter ATP-binding protein [Lactobacillus sp. W8093]MBI0109949.1 ABC transporter ATP-binding protein [Lactobacillus sp. W8093]
MDQVRKKQMGISTFSSRLSAVKYTDKILFLPNGRVLGFDAHKKLIRTNADYRKMYNLQKGAYV